MKHEELSSEALHALVNSAIEGIISIDSTGNIRTTNPAAEEMLGYAAGELIGKKVNDLMPSPYHEEHDAYLARYHETGEKKVIGAEQEVSAKRKDGTVFPIALSVSEFTLGEEKMFTGIMRDIQDKKQAEAERDRFFTLSLDLLCIAGVDGFFKRLNPAFESVLGYTTDELLGKPFFDFIHPDDVDATIREVERIRQGSQTIDFENRYRCKDGSYRWFLWTAAPAEGELIYAAARDITDTKEVENALKVSAQVAEAASLAKSKFLANMSHEIRTPMNGVMGMVSLLLNTELSPLQREYLETIQSSSDSLLNVINDILDLSRIEAGKLEIDSVPFDLRKAVEEVIELLSVRARDKDVECILRYPLEGPRHVIGDPGRIRQVLTNLIGNAVKFTEEGHIFVGVDFEGETGQSVSLRFTVRDTGIGISDAQLSKIFDKFTQADASTTRQYGGSGLGLTITRQLVELMGGTLSVKSSLGRGSSFGFGLKLDLHRELIEEPVKAADLKGVKILIVDDIAVTGRVLTEQLTLWGMRPFTSDSGVSAISALRRARESDDPFRMAIVDFHMPGMDGMSLGRIVKEDPGLKDTALIFASSVGHRGDAKEVREAGFSAYLVKPIRPSILLEVLNSIWSAASEGKTPEFATRYTLGEPITRPVQPVSKPFQDGPQFDMKVLIAEDNTVNLVVAENLLKMFGCKVETAANGLLALKALQQTTFDLVFMDCQMPEMDGYNATRRIRDLESDVRNIPIIAMTAHAMETDRQACLDAGMNDHITKPLTDKDFLRILQKFSNRQPPQAPSAAGGSIDIERWRYLATMTGSYDATFAASLIDAFTEETPRKMQELRDTIASGNTSDIEDAAHALTGSGANIGAMKFSELAEQIELDAESGVVENADRLFGDLRKELKQVIQDLEGLRDG